MLFSSVGVGGVAAVSVLGATGNLFSTLRMILDGADGGKGEAVSKLKADENLAAALLTKLQQQQQPTAPAPITIVQGKSHGDRITMLVLVGLGGGAIFYACKTQLVSKKDVKEQLGKVGDKLNNLTANVGVIREKMQIAYNHLRKRLDHSIEMQNDLKEDITEVQQSIEDVKEDTETITNTIEGCKQELIEASRKHEFTCRGVQLLCGVVAESMPTGKSKKELEAFLKGNPGMLPPSASGLRRSRSDRPRREIAGENQTTPIGRRLAITADDDAAADQQDQDQDDDTYLSDRDDLYTSDASMSECAPPPRKNYSPRNADLGTADQNVQ